MVALLAEGVGRNAVGICFSAQTPKVALLAEGVGRNDTVSVWVSVLAWSPSSRRAWVEILVSEGYNAILQGSPSSRRAWVEIVYARLPPRLPPRRPPRGGRG